MNHSGKIRLMEFRSTYKWGGGPDKTVLNSARLHDKKRFEVTVVYLRSKSDKEFVLGDKARAMGIDVIEVVEEGPLDLSVFKRVMQIIKERKIDILHSRDYKTNLIALVCKLFNGNGLKIVTTAHGWVSQGFKISIYYFFDKIISSMFDRTFILYRDQLNEFIVRPSQGKIVVVHNAIDQNDWERGAIQRGAIKTELGIQNGSVLIGVIGRLMPEKDILTTISVADELINKKKLDCQFLVVGEGKDANYEREVRKAIHAANLDERVHLMGKRKDIKEIYGDLDIFLLTSVREGIPNSQLEAMAMEVPCVLSRVGGIPEIIEDRKSGILCQPKAIAEFASGVELLMRDADLRQTIAQNARYLIEHELTFERRLRKMEEEYEKLVVV